MVTILAVALTGAAIAGAASGVVPGDVAHAARVATQDGPTVGAMALAAGAADAEGSHYVGSEACQNCHALNYQDFVRSGHPYKLQTPEEAQERGLPTPDGWTWDEIWLVIGGVEWKSRYIDQDGYIITMTGPGHDVPGKNQFNVETGRWVDYEPGTVKPYTCGACHTTGYSPQGHQEDKPGAVGTWALKGVQCERCHGPGSEHIQNPVLAPMKIDTSAAACGACHTRGDPAKIPAKGGFIQHHESYNELLGGAHADTNCVDCHNPHKPSEESITTPCLRCHIGSPDAPRVFQLTSLHGRAGVACEDCHMPEATKSAESFGAHQADLKTHLFAIDPDPAFYTVPAGASFANGAIDVGFACLACHDDKDRAWAGAYAVGMHADADHDTFSDADERAKGSDPNDPLGIPLP